jgi:hypothetical protein
MLYSILKLSVPFGVTQAMNQSRSVFSIVLITSKRVPCFPSFSGD